MSNSVLGMMWENILYLFPNLGIWTIRQEGIWWNNEKNNIVNIYIEIKLISKIEGGSPFQI